MTKRGGLLNYTTSIAVEQTIGEILGMLVKGGASRITTDYEAGQPVGVAFVINTLYGVRGYRLPANISAVEAVLRRQYQQGKVDRRGLGREQAARVGWRIVRDWLEAQMAVIQTEMVSLDQIMLPYMRGAEGKTFYELYVEDQRALPEGRADGD